MCPKFTRFDISNFMKLQFLRFYTLFGVLVVVWLYELSSLITATRSIKFLRLRLMEDFDILLEMRLREIAEWV